MTEDTLREIARLALDCEDWVKEYFDALVAEVRNMQTQIASYDAAMAQLHSDRDGMQKLMMEARLERDRLQIVRDDCVATAAALIAERDAAVRQIPTEQPPDCLQQGRLLLNAYGRTCYMAGIDTGTREAQAATVDANAELDWLKYFYQQADFGPAHGDVLYWIKQDYKRTGKPIPEGYDDSDTED